MKVPAETICSIETCKKIFCCEKCRQKHEEKTHAIDIKSRNNGSRTASMRNGETTVDKTYVLCPICSNQPFVLHHENYPEGVLEHIRQMHLPLRCQKCARVYSKIEELRDFSKCVKPSSKSELAKCVPDDRSLYVPVIKITDPNKYAPAELNTISTQTSPMLTGVSESVSLKGLRWITRTHKAAQEVSFSSIKNLSLTDSHRRQTDAKGKLVRTTSTPLQYEVENPKPKEQAFKAFDAHVSSIYNSGCEIENEKNSPTVSTGIAEKPANLLAVPPQVDSISVYRKLGGRSKVAAVTPLRHVMSKSIQKAFAEHGPPSVSEEKHRNLNEASSVLSNIPLDLRLSPALRRSQSDSGGNVKFIASNYLPPARRTTTNTLVLRCAAELRSYEITDEAINSDSALSSSSNSSVYKTCQSIEFITSTELNEIKGQDNVFAAVEANDELCALKNVYLQKSPKASAAVNTPITRLPGANITKKLIKFETPNVKNNSSNEKFYTPKGDLSAECNNTSKSFNFKSADRRESIRFSPMCRPSIRECAQSTAYSHCEIDYESSDEVFLTPTNGDTKNVRTSDQSTQHGNGFIWSFMSSVMQKGTRFLDNKRLSFDTDAKVKNSLVKCCSSIAASVMRSNSLLDEKQFQSLKRKRSNTFDSQTSPLSSLRRTDSLPQNFDNLSSSKRFRIQGRKPIERMRNTSL